MTFPAVVESHWSSFASLLSHKSYFPFDEKLVACSQDHHSLTFFCNSLPSSVTAVQPALGELVCVHLYCLYSKSYCLQLFLCTLTWNKKKIKTRTICSTMHNGLRADILKKAIRKCLTLKIDFSANFNLTHDFFGRRLSQHPKNWKTQK